MAMDASHPRKDEFRDKYPKLCFVGHPKAGGMALTLTASPTEIFYSNDFSGEGRMQAEDRAHRPGMDVNKGLTIVDYIHLQTDLYVLENLQKKKDLQSLSLGELRAALDAI
jgi:SNF2 family DNA or RNA helicase